MKIDLNAMATKIEANIKMTKEEETSMKIVVKDRKVAVNKIGDTKNMTISKEMDRKVNNNIGKEMTENNMIDNLSVNSRNLTWKRLTPTQITGCFIATTMHFSLK